MNQLFIIETRYNVEKPETSYVQLRLFGRKDNEEKFNQIVNVNCKHNELNFFDVMISVYDKVIPTEPLCNVLWQLIATIYSLLSIFFYLSQNELEQWRKQKPFSWIEIKIGTSSCCTNNLQNFSRKNNLNLSWNATVAWNWKSGSLEKGFLSTMDNIQW